MKGQYAKRGCQQQDIQRNSPPQLHSVANLRFEEGGHEGRGSFHGSLVWSMVQVRNPLDKEN
jgi:hypothetical protein